jgi:hypothetical protein
MKKIALYLGMLGLVLALVSPASAATIGTISGTGLVTVDGNGNPTAYSFSGPFAYDNVTIYYDLNNNPLGTFAYIMGDVGQYTFAANKFGVLTAWDSNGGAAPLYNRGNDYNWMVNNPNSSPGFPDTNLYGKALSFDFTPIDASHGTLTGTVTSSDGYFHWYYGNDPAGMTPIAAFGVSSTFLFSGTYTTTGWIIPNTPSTFNIEGKLSAVPLPGALVLLGAGLVRLARYSRRKRSLV